MIVFQKKVSSGKSIAADKHSGASELNSRLYSFVGGKSGEWIVTSSKAIVGDPLTKIDRLSIVSGSPKDVDKDVSWVLRGVTSNERYTNRYEKNQLLQKQIPLGRPTSTLSALIPIRKNKEWWALTQDERRAIFEERSHHVSIGLKYLPAISRRLHHCRDLQEAEPFDFLTLFDFDKSNESAFDDMLAELRATEEWKYIDREVDIRLKFGLERRPT